MKRIFYTFLLFNSLILASNSQIGRLVKDFNPGFSSGLNITYGFDSRIASFNGKLFMVANEDKVGEELYIYDPVSDIISLVKDIKTNNKGPASIYQLKSNQSHLFFVANDGVNGDELFTSEGTSLGTLMLKNINPIGNGVSQYPEQYAITPNGIYFQGEDSNGKELWFSDGTPAGTKMILDLNPGTSGSYPSSLLFHKGLNKLFFSGTTSTLGSEPYISDGTSSKTLLIKDLVLGSLDSRPYGFSEFGNKVLFVGITGYKNGNDVHELFISDGTSAGTSSLLSLEISFSSPNYSNFTLLGNKCLFSANNLLYITDGTKVGTILLNNKLVIDDSKVFIKLNNSVIFSAKESINGKELYITDGTIPGTKLLKDIVVGTGSSYLFDFLILKNKVYFIVDKDANHSELWETDGTIVGTKRSFVIDSTSETAMTNLTLLNNKLYFVGADDPHGGELWEFDPLISNISSEKKVSSIQIYPNPANNKLNLISSEEILKIEVLDINGIKMKDCLNKINQIDIANLASGTYYLRMELISKKIEFTRFVKL